MRRLLISIAVLYLYYPHRWVIRTAGPVLAVISARLLARGHWLLTFAGAGRGIRAGMEQVLGASRFAGSLRAELHRYYLNKYQNYCERVVLPTRRGRRFARRRYCRMQGRQHVESALADGGGAILLVFHFGMAATVWHALQTLGFEVGHHVARGATYSGLAFDWVADAALKRTVAEEAESGLDIVYHEPFVSFEILRRRLQRNQLVGINGDGTMGSDFIGVPFAGATLTLPTGPARLAAIAGAPLIPLFCLPDRLLDHRIEVHAPIRCEEDSPKVIRECVGRYAKLLEQYVTSHPGHWWTWRRLDVNRAEDGSVLLEPRPLAQSANAHRQTSNPKQNVVPDKKVDPARSGVIRTQPNGERA